jgi:hypothetical protein
MWSPHIIRTFNATLTNITRWLKYNHKLYGPNLNQQQQGLSTTSGKEHSHLFSAQLRWGPYRPVYWKWMLTTASCTWTCFCILKIIALPFWNRRDELGSATKGWYCRTPHLNVMEPVNIPNKMFLQVTDSQYKNCIYHEGACNCTYTSKIPNSRWSDIKIFCFYYNNLSKKLPVYYYTNLLQVSVKLVVYWNLMQYTIQL